MAQAVKMFAIRNPFVLKKKQQDKWVENEVIKRQKFRVSLNIDNSDDVLYEVMKHMDAKSLATAACVSKKWKKLADDESLWENVCTQHWPSPVSRQSQLRSVVLALGGFRRLYIQCLRPILVRARPPRRVPSSAPGQDVDTKGEREWSKDEVHLSLSLFSIDCYERLSRRHLTSSSLKLLCKPPANLGLPHRILAMAKP